MERKKISEITKLKFQNANLSLQVLQLQANQIIANRDKILREEFKRLKCNFEEWKLDEQIWELFKIDKKSIGEIP